MKVLHVITGLGKGGAEGALYRLLAERGPEQPSLVISLTNEGHYAERIRALGVPVAALSMRSAADFARAFFRLRAIAREFSPEVMQTWMYHADLLGGLVGKLSGIPVCWGIRHSDLSAQYNSRSTLLVARLCALLSRRVPTLIVSCSRRGAETHVAFGYAGIFRVIANGLRVPAELAGVTVRSQVRAALGIDERAQVIGHVGRADPQKDHPTLLSAFDVVADRHPAACLLMVGKDLEPDAAYMRRLLERCRHRSRVFAVGARHDVPSLMAAMDVFALTSVGEGFPNVVAEAMAQGTPCVVTDAGDAAEIVGDTGWVCRPLDATAIASSIAEALDESPASRAARRASAHARIAERFGMEAMVRGYDAAWSEAVGRAAPCAG